MHMKINKSEFVRAKVNISMMPGEIPHSTLSPLRQGRADIFPNFFSIGSFEKQ